MYANISCRTFYDINYKRQRIIYSPLDELRGVSVCPKKKFFSRIEVSSWSVCVFACVLEFFLLSEFDESRSAVVNRYQAS